ncbi:hypothetical protein H4R19_002272 [Coemansia spiralis]|nr:hypothetical protein H4R19_002272 [Coemansia spiralis]
MDQPVVVCLEFFSGIGGLHHGLLESAVGGRVAQSWDMNENANAVYYHTFGQRPSNKAIDYLTVADIDRFGASCWLLSPPCQPYTRGGNYGDADDPRARGLLHLLRLLPRVEHRPTHLFLENVLNFENSQSRAMLVETLFGLGFEVLECLLSPVQFGIPNRRLRYFLIARLRWPEPGAAGSCRAAWMAENTARAEAYMARGRNAVHTEWPFGPAGDAAMAAVQRPLGSYIDPASDAVPSLRVPDADILKRKRLGLDIVLPTSPSTATFTKAYGSGHLIGSGSLLQTQSLDTDGMAAASPEELLGLGLRFFSPDEVARLHHFPIHKSLPHSLNFPPQITQRQRHQLLGNSLNVHVVAQLLKHVLFSESLW